MGSELTYQCIGPNQYRVTLKFYRDCSGILPLSSYTVYYSSPTCGVSNSTITISQVGAAVEVTPLCPGAPSSCGGGSGAFGIEQYTFQGTLNLPPGCSDWYMRWYECCRNDAITTLDAPGSQSMQVYARLNNTLTPCDNSPVFNNTPTAIVCVGQPVNFNHGASDPDGDSLSFSLTTCLQTGAVSVDYAAGFSGTVPLTTASGVSINPVTGQITFTPTAVQIGVMCVLVEEWRGGVKIGEVVRDMQFNVIACSNAPPVATGMNGTAIFDTSICVGSNICFFINTSDANANNITMTWNSGIPTGSMVITGSGGLSPSATFCWTPTIADLGVNVFTVTVTDNACLVSGTSTFTYRINVLGTPNTLSAGSDVSICQGSSTVLTATSTGATSYTWSPAAGLSCTSCASPVASPSVTTTYTVTANFTDGCSLTDAVLVTVRPLPSVSITPSAINSCAGSLLFISATSPTGVSWLWSTGGTSNAILVSPVATTSYWVQTTDAFGCTARDTVVVSINTPAVDVCNVVYASPTGSGTGTQASPASLTNAIAMAGCNNTVIKLAIGTYTIDNAINLPGFLTLEGGFDPALAWRKTSAAGATIILRSTLNVQNAAGVNPRLTAFYVNGQSNFRFQDLTIQVANAPANGPGTAGISTYGVHLTNCSNYTFVRTQILGGSGGVGDAGVAGVAGVAGGGGVQGSAGSCDGTSCPGGVGAPAGGAGGTGGSGVAAGASGTGRIGGGGGAGGQGSSECTSNAAAGACGGGSASLGLNCGGGVPGAAGDPGGDGSNGNNGANGTNGANGAAGTAGSRVTGYWNPGGQGATGTDGTGGQGGKGGGGGGRQTCFFCDDGPGNGGAGGGGGGQGGSAGTGGFGGGSSYCAYLYNNGAGGSFDDCRLVAGATGAGGAGGTGGSAGTGGTGGARRTTCTSEIGEGGAGGNGGTGGTGGNGGAGSAGEALQVVTDGGSALTLTDINFNLPAQPVIFLENVSCTNTDIDYSTAVSAAWTFGAGSSPAGASGTLVTTQYSTLGRKNPVYNGNTYTGFTNIILDDNVVPIAGTTAPLVGGLYRVCAGSAVNFMSLNPGINYTYLWTMGGGSVPNTYSGITFVNVTGAVFNTPGVYYITLQYQTDCCGLSALDSIELHVDAQPVAAIAGGGSFCYGDGVGRTLTASGATSYTWTPVSGLIPSTGPVVNAYPTTTTTYTVLGVNAEGTCSDDATVTVTVNNLNLTPASTAVSCGANGTASVVPSGGSGSYSYVWSTGATTSGLTGLLSGTYSVTVTDLVTGCVNNTAVFVNPGPGALTAWIATVTPVSCFGATNGTATVSHTGGSGPAFAYSWVTVPGGVPVGGGGATTTPLPAGTYAVTVFDLGAPGCFAGALITIPSPGDLLLALVDTTSTTCLNTPDGTATVNASGGTGPFSYVWSTVPVQTGPTASGLLPGSYTCTVTDANGCIETFTATVVAQNPCILPVEYLYFTANPGAGLIRLNWETTAEVDSRGFEVQRSTDGLNFDKIGWLDSRGVSGAGAAYELKDVRVEPGITYYYRLKQVDLDGAHTFSEIREAILPDDGRIVILTSYPNPVENDLFVEFEIADNARMSFDVLGVTGQELGIHQEMQLDAGRQKVAIHVDGVAAGMYFLRIRMDGQNVGAVKFFKVK